MQKASLLTVFLLFGVTSLTTETFQERSSVDRVTQEILALERSALDRWIALDPEGYRNLYAPDVTYFDPTTDLRVDLLKAMQERLARMKSAKSPFSDRRYEMVGREGAALRRGRAADPQSNELRKTGQST